MKFLANENIPQSVCQRLREEGNIDITSMLDIAPGVSDKDVVALAQKEKRIILTFDRDFGELVFKEKARVKGIVLLRFTPSSPDAIFQKIKNLISKEEISLQGNFVVVDEDRVRMRAIK